MSLIIYPQALGLHLAVAVGQGSMVSSMGLSPRTWSPIHTLKKSHSFRSVNKLVASEGFSSGEPHLVFHETLPKGVESTLHSVLPPPGAFTQQKFRNNFYSGGMCPGETGDSQFLIKGK